MWPGAHPAAPALPQTLHWLGSARRLGCWNALECDDFFWRFSATQCQLDSKRRIGWHSVWTNIITNHNLCLKATSAPYVVSFDHNFLKWFVLQLWLKLGRTSCGVPTRGQYFRPGTSGDPLEFCSVLLGGNIILCIQHIQFTIFTSIYLMYLKIPHI